MGTVILLLSLVLQVTSVYAAQKEKGDLYASIACKGDIDKFLPTINIHIFKSANPNDKTRQVYLESTDNFTRQENYREFKPELRTFEENGSEKTMIEIVDLIMTRTIACAIKPSLMKMDYLKADTNEVLALKTSLPLCGFGEPVYFFMMHDFGSTAVTVSGGYVQGDCTWTSADAEGVAK